MNALQNIRSALHPKTLNLIILPTEKCNFRCTYCYETFEVGKMKQPTVAGIKKLLATRVQRQTLDVLSLGWFGGELTLALEVVYEICEYAKRFHEEGKLKKVFGDMTTNGYRLDVETLRRLVGLWQSSFQISLDGHGEGHDVTRRYASGKGTFATIWRNLLEAHETDLNFKILLRLHQTADNGDSMQRLVDEIVRRLAGDRRFSIFFKPIENLGGNNSANISKMDLDIATQRVRRFAAQFRAAGFAVSAILDGPESSRGDLDEGGADPIANRAPAEPAGYVCYASKPNSLVIRADGRVAKCTVLFDDPRNTIGQLNSDGTITIDNDLLKIWTRGLSSWDPMELGCPAQNLPKINVVEKPIKLQYLPRKTAALVA